MQIIALGTGPCQILHGLGKELKSSILKTPRPGPIVLGELGLEGDTQSDPRFHGGPDQALYVYPFEHYANWCTHLGRNALPMCGLGENLTSRGILEEDLPLGTRLRSGAVLLEVSAPRIPCEKLDMLLGDARAGQYMIESGHTGFYCRVLAGGALAAGDVLAVEPPKEPGPTIGQLHRLGYGLLENAELARRALAHPALPAAFKKRLARATATLLADESES